MCKPALQGSQLQSISESRLAAPNYGMACELLCVAGHIEALVRHVRRERCSPKENPEVVPYIYLYMTSFCRKTSSATDIAQLLWCGVAKWSSSKVAFTCEFPLHYLLPILDSTQGLAPTGSPSWKLLCPYLQVGPGKAADIRLGT